jgi:hypothetical protein
LIRGASKCGDVRRNSCAVQLKQKLLLHPSRSPVLFLLEIRTRSDVFVPIHRLYRCLRGRTYRAGLAARAQQAEGLRKVGVLVPAVASTPLGAFFISFSR